MIDDELIMSLTIHYKAKLKRIPVHDPEQAHGMADDILCELLLELGLNEVVEAYEQIEKWYA